MPSNTWNNKNFVKLCKKLDFPSSVTYQQSLVWKLVLANHHHNRSEQVIKDLYADLRKTRRQINMSGKEWQETEFQSEAEAIACIHVTNSIVDVFLQIINESILNISLKEHEVNMGAVIEQLKSIQGTDKIIEKLKVLKKSDEFQYIKSFDNTIKHRRLLEKTYNITWNASQGGRQGIKFKAFDYSDRKRTLSFQETWASDVTEDYRNKILDMTWEVGAEMTRFLRRKRKVSEDSAAVLQANILD